jgi:oxygen-dependent protoporphyrinogen oxidase
VRPARIAVVGGGITGLTAAYRLRSLLGPAAQITLIEGARRLGGAVRTVSLGDLPLDVGAEAFLVRRPEATALVEELGLGQQLTHPTDAAPTVRAGGATRPLPTRTVLGVPGDAADVAGLLSAQGVAQVAGEPSTPLQWTPGQDAAVGTLLRGRAGDELVDRLVDPLLGGVYAGRADALGLRATLPAIAAALDRGAGSLLAAAATALPPRRAPGTPRPPVFATLRGGLTTLVDALVRAAGAHQRLGLPVRGLVRTPAGWRIEVGSATRPEHLEADAVVLAVPAPALRRLLGGVSAPAAAAVGRIEVASSAVVGLALPMSAARQLPAASGVLVASGEPLAVKAFTFSGRKWAHAGSERTLLIRGSLGRHGEAHVLQRDDGELVDAVRADLAELTGITAEPLDTVVARWGGGLPQYAPGHLDAVATLERAVDAEPGLAVAGALLRGVGLPACIAGADAAARRLVGRLAAADAPSGPVGPWVHDPS